MGYPTQLNQLTVAAKFHTAANESYPCFSHEPENRLESFCLLGKSVNTFGRRRFPDDGTILRRDEIKQKRAKEQNEAAKQEQIRGARRDTLPTSEKPQPQVKSNCSSWTFPRRGFRGHCLSVPRSSGEKFRRV